MKTNLKPLIFISLAGLLIATFATCTKESINSKQQPITQHQISSCEIDVGLVCDNQIPHFSSQQDFDDAYICLETEYEYFNNTYENQYTSLSDNDYDDQVDSDLFNEDEPLDDWESGKNYTSLRTYLTVQEDVWLTNGMVGADPFDHAVADFIFMTLLNEDGDVKIGSDLYHFAADGSVIIVLDGDCEIFATAKSYPEYTHEKLINIPVTLETCQHTEREKGEKDFLNDENRKCKWRVDFDSYVTNSRAKTRVRNFRKKNGSWKRSAAKSRVRIEGQVWNNECLASSSFSYNEKTKRRKRLTTRRVIPSFAKIKTSEVFGEIEQINDNLEIDTTIVWP